MKKLLAIIVLCPLAAFAGKAEREYMNNTVNPAIAKAQTDFKTACGCALTIQVAESIKTEDDLYQVKHVVEDLSNSAPGYCTDAESKKAVCQMKTLEITKGSETKFTFAGGKGVSVTDGQSYTGFVMMTPVLDK